MNKLKLLVLATAIIVGVPSIAGALQTNSIEVARDLNQETAVQVNEVGAAAVDSVTELMNRYMTNFRTCEPVHLSQSIDIFGLKASYQFDINGWVDNKCSYYMTGNIGGLGKDIRDIFKINVTDEDIAKIKPIVQCNFTQEQLDILVDGFVAAQERKVVDKLSSSSANVSTSGKKKLSPAEEKMMEMLMSGQACTVPNQEQLMQDFSKLMGMPTIPATPASSGANEPSPEVSVPEVLEPAAPQLDTLEEPVQEVEKPVLRPSSRSKVNLPQAPQL
jgi:hypothetical protein